jgi:hypothetical protein
MIHNYDQIKIERENRLDSKSVQGLFYNLVYQGTNCSEFESRIIAQYAQNIFNQEPEGAQTLKAGQLCIIGVAAAEPAGKAIDQCQLKQAVVTLDSGQEDQKVRLNYEPLEAGTTALRRFRLARICQEALDQGVLLSQEDLAYRIFNCGERTIRRDISAFKKQGIFIPTRGQQKDIGRGVTHRSEAVRRYILRHPASKIAQDIYHSLAAVERYLTHFARINFLHQTKGMTDKEIAFATKLSLPLVKEYLELYRQMDTPENQERLAEILQIAKPFEGENEVRPPQKKSGGLK